MKENIQIQPSTKEDYAAVNKLLAKASDAVLPVGQEEFFGWVIAGDSLVAKTTDGTIIGHQAIAVWEVSQWSEVRSAFVEEGFRGQGINSQMKGMLINKRQEEMPESPICLLAELKSTSPSLAVKGGFVKVPLGDIPEEFFSACPTDMKDVCFKITQKDPSSCECRAFVLEPGKKFNVQQ